MMYAVQKEYWMSASDIPMTQWLDFLDHFSRRHRAWLATVDRLRPVEPNHTEAVARPLASVMSQRVARGIARIEIGFQENSSAREPIRIDAPTHVRIDETADGVARGLRS
jgi:hypothetical protein